MMGIYGACVSIFEIADSSRPGIIQKIAIFAKNQVFWRKNQFFKNTLIPYYNCSCFPCLFAAL